MNRTSRRRALRLAAQTAELMLVTSQVVAHRLARITAAAAGNSSHDQQEFYRMSAEKFAAFGESWSQMLSQTLKANQQMARALMLAPWLNAHGMSGAARVQSSVARQMHTSSLQIISSGLAPVHKRALANAKRLRRTKIR